MSDSPLIKPEGEVRARHILVEGEDQAKALAERVRNGADFATLAKAVSADPDTARGGGILGWRIKSELPDKLAAAAFALEKAGDLSGPVQTEAGWHLLRLEERRTRAIPSFAQLKDHIVRVLAKNKAKELARDLREKAQVVYSDPQLALAAATGPPTAPAAAVPEVAAARALIRQRVPPALARAGSSRCGRSCRCGRCSACDPCRGSRRCGHVRAVRDARDGQSHALAL